MHHSLDNWRTGFVQGTDTILSPLCSFVLAALLVIGLYFPTSLGGMISKEMQYLFSGVLFLLLAPLLLRKGGAMGGWSIPTAMAISGILFLATLASPFTSVAYGAFVPVLLFSIIYSLRLKDLRLTRIHRSLFTAAHLVNLICGAFVILQEPLALEFIGDHYAAAYPELVANMLIQQKPVLMFHSHSVAAFYFYVFFFITFRTYGAAGGRLNLLIALGYLALTCWVNSFTAYALLALAVIQLCHGLGWARTRRFGIVAGVVIIAVVAAGSGDTNLDELWWRVGETLASPTNGLQGRYSGSGGLTSNLDYIARNPFSPIGLGYSEQLVYGDSGPVTYMIRGSVPLLIAVYGGLFLFFWKNLRSRRDALFLFLVYIGFETGYGNLEYLRTQYLLPFLVVYMNSLPDPAPVPGAAGSQRAAGVQGSFFTRMASTGAHPV